MLRVRFAGIRLTSVVASCSRASRSPRQEQRKHEPQPGNTAGPERRHQVVIIGSGFGGLNAAKKLKHANVDIKLIARTTHHLFQPLLYQVATGIVSEGDIAPPTRVVLRRQRNVQVLLGDVTHIDLEGKFVVSDLLGHTYDTPYDSLIIAAGASNHISATTISPNSHRA